MWNKWRGTNWGVSPDLAGIDLSSTIFRKANFSGANLLGADFGNIDFFEDGFSTHRHYEFILSGVDLSGIDLSGANLQGANFRGANLEGANFTRADISNVIEDEFSEINSLKDFDSPDDLVDNFGSIDYVEDENSYDYFDEDDYESEEPNQRFVYTKFINANLSGACLANANLPEVHLRGADLSHTDLRNVNLNGAKLLSANMSSADLSNANLGDANLTGTNLHRAKLNSTCLNGANLKGVNLMEASLLETKLNNASIEGAKVYGIAAWNIEKEGLIQKDLIITRDDEPKVTVDDLEMAQFIYLMLNNQKIRDVIDTLTSKAVLILGRFSEERKPLLDAIKEELRLRNYLPILFDFEKPAGRNLTETISILAKMSRFVIADLTDAKSIPQELSHIVPFTPSLPVLPIILEGQKEYAMFEHFKAYPWVMPLHAYASQEAMLAEITEKIIAPAEQKAAALRAVPNHTTS